jgi:hypothetical protein
MSIWTILFIVLLVAGIGGFTVFHVAGGLIRLLLMIAVISLILHCSSQSGRARLHPLSSHRHHGRFTLSAYREVVCSV